MLSDDRVMAEYQKSTINQTDWATHDLTHALNVVKNCEKISRLLNLEETQIEEIKIAALLHDIGVGLIGKKNHAQRSCDWVNEYFKNESMTNEAKERILEAIKCHGGDAQSLYGKILVLADKLDVNKERITSLGLCIVGNRQYANIREVDFEIKDNVFWVKFKAYENIDINELSAYYFTPKIFNAIKDFALQFDFEYKVFMNDKEWILNNI